MSLNINGNLAYDYRQNYVKKTKQVRKTKKKTMPATEKVFYIFSVFFVVAIASIVISGYAQIAEYNYSIQKLEKSIYNINQENESLQTEIAELSSPERVLYMAQNDLGMTLDESQVIVLSRN